MGKMNGPLRRTKKGKGIREARRGEGKRGREGKRKRQGKADGRDIQKKEGDRVEDRVIVVK